VLIADAISDETLSDASAFIRREARTPRDAMTTPERPALEVCERHAARDAPPRRRPSPRYATRQGKQHHPRDMMAS
jgi:hypothetical protein